MGYYTHFVFRGRLYPNDHVAPIKEFITKCMTPVKLESGEYDYTLPQPPDDHEFFSCPRWDSVITWLYTNGCKEHGTIIGDTVTINTIFKNYDHEIELFLDWIFPYVFSDTYISIKPEDMEDAREYFSYYEYITST